MTTIGTFSQATDGGFRGSIRTFTLNLKTVELRVLEAKGPKAPHFRVLGGDIELGAAWRKVGRSGRNYILVELDDPCLAQPVFARLIEIDGGFALVWSRERKAN